MTCQCDTPARNENNRKLLASSVCINGSASLGIGDQISGNALVLAIKISLVVGPTKLPVDASEFGYIGDVNRRD